MPVRLFIGNLPYSATEADLREHFAPVGPPSSVAMPVDRETGRPRGFAFVEFADRAIGEEVIRRFDGQAFMGRSIAVSEARARDDRSGPPPPRYSPGPPRSMEGPGGGGAPRPGGPSRGPFGPEAPRRKPGGGPATRRGKKEEKGPKGPIPIRTGGRVYDVEDLQDDTTSPNVDFEDFATSAPSMPDTTDTDKDTDRDTDTDADTDTDKGTDKREDNEDS